jgi:hypothetical protein
MYQEKSIYNNAPEFCKRLSTHMLTELKSVSIVWRLFHGPTICPPVDASLTVSTPLRNTS